MLITITDLMRKFDLRITGILHVGAHECEEMSDYIKNGVQPNNIFWIEAMTDKVDQMKSKYGDKVNIYQAVIDLNDGKVVTFYKTNNGQSSSILEFGTHSKNHPQVHVTETQQMITSRLDTVIEKQKIPIERVNFINLDIQGVELRALQSMEKYLAHIDYIYTEVNTEEVYKGCAKLAQIDAYLNQFGFKRYDTRIYREFGWGDAFYIKITNP